LSLRPVVRFGSAPTYVRRSRRLNVEMALHVLAYNLTRVMNIIGSQPLMAAIKA
jgi:hypothetical protein